MADSSDTESTAIDFVASFHLSAKKSLGIKNPMEVSSVSESALGKRLSALNLTLDHDRSSICVESLYQGSKIFELGGPFTDLYQKAGRDAKRDARLKNSGKLLGFRFTDIDWPLSNSPNFYDYLYARALNKLSCAEAVLEHDGFTDYFFTQHSLLYSKNRSFNTQARSVAIYASLLKHGLVSDYLSNFEQFQVVTDSNPQEPSLFDFL